jgi:hypothetical protein
VNLVVMWKKRLIIILAMIVTGAGAGWLALNLFVDFLVGGRLF